MNECKLEEYNFLWIIYGEFAKIEENSIIGNNILQVNNNSFCVFHWLLTADCWCLIASPISFLHMQTVKVWQNWSILVLVPTNLQMHFLMCFANQSIFFLSWQCLHIIGGGGIIMFWIVCVKWCQTVRIGTVGNYEIIGDFRNVSGKANTPVTNSSNYNCYSVVVVW